MGIIIVNLLNQMYSIGNTRCYWWLADAKRPNRNKKAAKVNEVTAEMKALVNVSFEQMRL